MFALYALHHQPSDLQPSTFKPYCVPYEGQGSEGWRLDDLQGIKGFEGPNHGSNRSCNAYIAYNAYNALKKGFATFVQIGINTWSKSMSANLRKVHILIRPRKYSESGKDPIRVNKIRFLFVALVISLPIGHECAEIDIHEVVKQREATWSA